VPELLGVPYAATLVSGTDLTAATVTCTVTAPDGTVGTPTVTIAGTTATAVVVPAQVGTYLLTWAVTGAVTGGQTDQFTVEAPTLDLVSLSEVKSELNINPTDTSKDAKLREWMRAATGVVENVTGAILPAPRTTSSPAGAGRSSSRNGGCRRSRPCRWRAAATTLLTEQTFGATGTATGTRGTGSRTPSPPHRRYGAACSRRGASCPSPTRPG
jgi:hypothetical protein